MKKTRKLFASVLLLILSLLVRAQPEHSFFVIHCDPGYADNIHWNTLNRMADSASFYGVPLTMEFSPQWVDMILSDQNKINLIRTWQQKGHEIAGHHHSIYHCMWDSLTNYPDDSIIANQPVYNDDGGTNCDSGILKSPMQPFYDNLDILAGDSLLLTWGSSDEHPEVDLYPDLLYRTSGGRDSAQQGFSDVYVETYGPTTLSNGTYGPYTVCLIDYFFISTQADVNEMIGVYNNTAFSGQFQAAGVVTHVFNVKNSNPNMPNNFFYRWLRFISGKGCKTVRNIMRAEGCSTTSVKKQGFWPAFSVYPNPSKNRLFVKGKLESSLHFTIINVLGQNMQQGNISNGSIDISALPAGLYYLRLVQYGQTKSTMRFVKE